MIHILCFLIEINILVTKEILVYAAITLFLIILSFKLFSQHFPITNSNEDKILVLVCSYLKKR
jgi:hypothetical protein